MMAVQTDTRRETSQWPGSRQTIKSCDCTTETRKKHVIGLLSILKRRCIAKEKLKTNGWLSTMMSRLTTLKGNSKRRNQPSREKVKPSKTDVTYSKLSLEDRQYLKSQIAIWFPCLIHRPTLSELETALAEMGTRILRNVAAIQVMDFNPSLTLSKKQRKLFRKNHNALTLKDVGLLMNSAASKKVEDSLSLEAEELPDMKMSNLSFVSAKLEHLQRKTSSNSFIYGEKNWRHRLMADDTHNSTEPESKDHNVICAIDRSRLFTLYDKRMYKIPNWFHWLIRTGAAIELEFINMEQVDSSFVELKELVDRPRRISLHVIPPGDTTFVKGHLFVSVREEERLREVKDKYVNFSANNIVAPLTEVPTGARKLPLPSKDGIFNFSLPRPLNKLADSDTECNTRLIGKDLFENLNGFDDFFPEERTLSFEHKWAYVLPKPKKKANQTRRKRQNRDIHGDDTIDQCANNSLSKDNHQITKQIPPFEITNPISAPPESRNEVIVGEEATRSRMLYDKLRNLLRRNKASKQIAAPQRSAEVEPEKVIESTSVQSLKHHACTTCHVDEYNVGNPVSEYTPEKFSVPKTREDPAKRQLKSKQMNIHATRTKQRTLKSWSLQNNKKFDTVPPLDRNGDTVLSQNTHIITVPCDAKGHSKRRRKKLKRAVRFVSEDSMRQMDKSNSSLSETGPHPVTAFFFDDIAGSRSTDCIRMLNVSQNRNTDGENTKHQTKSDKPSRTIKNSAKSYSQTRRYIDRIHNNLSGNAVFYDKDTKERVQQSERTGRDRSTQTQRLPNDHVYLRDNARSSKKDYTPFHSISNSPRIGGNKKDVSMLDLTENVRGSLSNFVKEQWRSCNDELHSSSSKNLQDLTSSDGHSSRGESESTSLKPRLYPKHTNLQSEPQSQSNNLINYLKRHRSNDKSSLKGSMCSSEVCRIQSLRNHSFFSKQCNQDAYTRNDEVKGENYTESEREKDDFKIAWFSNKYSLGESSSPEHILTDFENDRNDDSLTNEPSIPTSSLFKITSASTTVNEHQPSLSNSPDYQCRNTDSPNQPWLTLSDLSTILTYCSKIISSEEPLTEGTMEVLKAVDETLSRYFLEDCGRIKTFHENILKEKTPKTNIASKCQDCPDESSIKYKTGIDMVKLAKRLDFKELGSQLTQKFTVNKASVESLDNDINGLLSPRFLDETQNKLDSDNEEPFRASQTSDSDHMAKRNSWEDIDMSHSHLRTIEEEDPFQSNPREDLENEMPAMEMPYSTDSLNEFRLPYEKWTNKMYPTNVPTLPTFFTDSPSLPTMDKLVTPTRQYYEQKHYSNETPNEILDLNRDRPRKAHNTSYDLTASGRLRKREGRETFRKSYTPRCPDSAYFSGADRHSIPSDSTNLYTPLGVASGTLGNKTASCLEGLCANNPPCCKRFDTTSRCLNCPEKVEYGSSLCKRGYKTAFFDPSCICPRRNVCDCPERIELPSTSCLPSCATDFSRARCSFPMSSALRHGRQSIGDMTSEFERKFGSSEEVTPVRKIPLSENLMMYSGDLCPVDCSPVGRRYPSLVPNLKKTPEYSCKPVNDPKPRCDKNLVQKETVEYITDLVKACLSSERRGNTSTAHCCKSETKVQTYKMNDEDRKLIESLKNKLDSTLLKCLLKEESHDNMAKPSQTVHYNDIIEPENDCSCLPKKSNNCWKYQKKREKPKVWPSCIPARKSLCEPKVTRMYSKGLQADMSWASGKNRAISVQTSRCVPTCRQSCVCGLATSSNTCLAKQSCLCGGSSPDNDNSFCGSAKLLTPKRRICPWSGLAEQAKCALIEDISSCTHLGRACTKNIDKRNKAIQTSIIGPVPKPCKKCAPCVRIGSNSVCTSQSEIYPKLSPERIGKLTSKYCSQDCSFKRNHCCTKKRNTDLYEDIPRGCFKPRGTNSFFIKKWDSPSECSTVTSHYNDLCSRPCKTNTTSNYPTLIPTSRTRRLTNRFTDNLERCKNNEDYHFKSAWLDPCSSKKNGGCNEPAVENSCNKDSPDANRPIVHIRYKSKKVNGKSEITVDSVPCKEGKINSPVKNLALQLKKHVEQIIQNSKELKQRALNAEIGCTEMKGDSTSQRDTTVSCEDCPSEVVKFHTSRNDDGSWSYKVKIKSPVGPQPPPEEMPESYASKNVNCGNNNTSAAPGQHRNGYGVKVDVSMPSAVVDEAKDRLIHRLLPEILKVVLRAILTADADGISSQDKCDGGEFEQRHGDTHENANGNACTDDFEHEKYHSDQQDKRLCDKEVGKNQYGYQHQKNPCGHQYEDCPCSDRHDKYTDRKLHSRYPITIQPTCAFHQFVEKERFVSQRTKKLFRRKFSADQRRFERRKLLAKQRLNTFPHAIWAEQRHRRHAHVKSQTKNDEATSHTDEMICSKHIEPMLSELYQQREMVIKANKKRREEKIEPFVLPSEHCRKHPLARAENSCSEFCANNDVVVSGEAREKFDPGLHHLRSKGHTIIIEDFSSISPSVTASGGPVLAHQSVCAHEIYDLRRGHSFRDKKLTEDISRKQPLAREMEPHKNVFTNVSRPEEMVCSHPEFVMECYDSTPELSADRHQRPSPENTLLQTLANTRQADDDRLGRTNVHDARVNVKHKRGDRNHALAIHDYINKLKTSMKKTKNIPVSGRCNVPYCKVFVTENTMTRVGDSESPKEQCSKEISDISNTLCSTDSGASDHGIEDLPLDSGTSVELPHSTTEMCTVRDASTSFSIERQRGEKHHGIFVIPKEKTSKAVNVENEPDSKKDVQELEGTPAASSSNFVEQVSSSGGKKSQQVSSSKDEKDPIVKTLNKTPFECWSKSRISATGNTTTSQDIPPARLGNKSPAEKLTICRPSDGYRPRKVMTDPRVVAAVLGTDVSRSYLRGWVACKDSSTLTENLLVCDKCMGVRDTKTRKPILSAPKVTRSLPLKVPSGTIEFQNSVQQGHEQPPTEKAAPLKAARNSNGWQSILVSSAELTESSSERVVLEGAFFKTHHPGDGPLCQTEQCSSYLPQSSTCLLPFRLVLFATGDDEEIKTISGTYLRRMVSMDRFFKWNIHFDIPIAST